MGILSKFRLDDRRKSLPLVPQGYKGHAKTYTSTSSAGGSDFLLTASASSWSLLDTQHKKHDAHKSLAFPTTGALKPLPKPEIDPPAATYNEILPHNHLPANGPRPLGQISPNRQNFPRNTSYSGGSGHNSPARQASPSRTNYSPASQKSHGGSPMRKPPPELQSGATQPPDLQSGAIQPPPKINFGRPPKQRPHSFQPQTIASMQKHQYAPQYPQGPYESENISAEFSEEESTSAESGLDDESDQENKQNQHPYYEQWKQYYAAMASYQHIKAQKRSDPIARHSMYSGLPVQKPLQPIQQRSADYINFYQNSSLQSSVNNLVRNSRRSTLKLTRSSSVPLLALRQTSQGPKSRAVSVNVTVPDQNILRPSTSHNDLADGSGAKPSRLGSTVHKLRPYGLLRLASKQEEGEISDYEAFLFDDTNGSSMHENSELVLAGANDTVVPITEEELAMKAGETEQTGPAGENTTPQQALAKCSPTEPAHPANDDITMAFLENHAELGDIIQHGAPNINHDDVDGLNRQGSSASTNSYNSLQSESNFAVGRNPHRLATPARSTGSKKKRTKNPQSFVPPLQGPPPPIFSSLPPLPGQDAYSYRQLVDLSLSGMGMADSMQFHQMQQQIHQLQQMQQMHMMPGYKNANYANQPYNGLPPPQTWSTDSTINARIQEFIELRQVIASGNKSIEYRLKWMKMLIVAVQYKLYAYVNIKGDSIGQDQVGNNKLFFVKSSVTHLQKLLKELDGPKLPASYDVLAEACYIYGCLLKHEYVERYDQDFNIERDDDEAEQYLLKCLQLNPAFFKAHFALADVYEKRNTEESFDKAFEHYKESASLGYYRGIYRVALIFLMVPRARSTSYFKYFRNLSEIDMQSSDIQLSGSDRDELEEVVGLALYQLGRIYEGIYPGDLTAEDEFVKESLELAPVNYAKSLSYYNRGAKHHCLLAQVKLGHVYENGDLNRNPNANKSIQWFIKASTSPLKFKRHPEAMLGISRWFMKGSNGQSKHIPAPDPQRAVEWCERACKEFQFPEAYFNMGLFAQQGLAAGNPEAWFEEAERLGYRFAEPNANEVGDGQAVGPEETS